MSDGAGPAPSAGLSSASTLLPSTVTRDPRTAPSCRLPSSTSISQQRDPVTGRCRLDLSMSQRWTYLVCERPGQRSEAKKMSNKSHASSLLLLALLFFRLVLLTVKASSDKVFEHADESALLVTSGNHNILYIDILNPLEPSQYINQTRANYGVWPEAKRFSYEGYSTGEYFDVHKCNRQMIGTRCNKGGVHRAAEGRAQIPRHTRRLRALPPFIENLYEMPIMVPHPYIENPYPKPFVVRDPYFDIYIESILDAFHREFIRDFHRESVSDAFHGESVPDAFHGESVPDAFHRVLG